MNSMTRLAFLIVLILMVTPSIVFHKSHTAAAQETLIDPISDAICVVFGDPDNEHFVLKARVACDVEAVDELGCTESFIRPPKGAELVGCNIACPGACWLCFGVNCPTE